MNIIKKNVEIKTKKAPKAVGPYSQAIDTGEFVFISGQIAINSKNNSFDENNSVDKQTKLVIENIKNILKEVSLKLSNVVKTEIYLINIDDFSVVNKIYEKYFKSNPKPARQTVEVCKLPLNAKIEISCIAKK